MGGTHLGETGDQMSVQSSQPRGSTFWGAYEAWLSCGTACLHWGVGSHPLWSRHSRSKEGVFLVHPPVSSIQLGLDLSPKGAQVAGV